MRTGRFYFVQLMLLVSIFAFSGKFALKCMAWEGMDMPPLHIEGRYLVDDKGNRILLHGFGQTYSPWFNEQGTKWNNYDVSACLKYNKAKIDGIMKAGWKVNWLRLHMDPYWSNTPVVQTKGENDISAFNMDRFKKYFAEVFLPMAEYAEGKGLYVVMRPPGVCPENISVGDAYQKYLIKVWTYVAQQVVEKGKTGIMFELANEPINVSGNGGITKFFQDVVDAIRATGCNNILWVPGRGYQSDYRDYAASPIKGDNIGYAVHAYPGWYGSDAEVESAENTGDVAGGGYKGFLNGWCERIKPVADFAPVLVTEMDWAPKKYNKSWGKSTTGVRGGSGFGANFKYMCDITGNVSWMLFTGPELLELYRDDASDGATFFTDPEACVRPIYRWFADYAKEWPYGKAEDAKRMTALTLDGSDKYEMALGAVAAIPVYAAFADGHTECVTATAQYTFGTAGVVEFKNGIVAKTGLGETVLTVSYTDELGNTKSVSVTIGESELFPLTNKDFNPSIWEKGTFDENTGTLVTGQYGFGGWQYGTGLDLSAYKYIVVRLKRQQNRSASFRLFDENNYWSDPAMVDFGSKTELVIDLHSLKKGEKKDKGNFDPSHIYIIGVWTLGGGSGVQFDEVFVSNDGRTPATAIENISDAPQQQSDDKVYNLRGECVGTRASVSGLPKGIYIINGKKIVIR